VGVGHFWPVLVRPRTAASVSVIPVPIPDAWESSAVGVGQMVEFAAVASEIDRFVPLGRIPPTSLAIRPPDASDASGVGQSFTATESEVTVYRGPPGIASFISR